MSAGKYRWRTWLRTHLPARLAPLVPKGKRDCGAHEWYRAGEHEWRCYHCVVGISEEVPWMPEDTIVKSALALRVLAEAARRRELADDEKHRAFALAAELVDGLERIGLVTTVDEAPGIEQGAVRQEVRTEVEQLLARARESLAEVAARTERREPSEHSRV